jgi:hypothetical protein
MQHIRFTPIAALVPLMLAAAALAQGGASASPAESTGGEAAASATAAAAAPSATERAALDLVRALEQTAFGTWLKEHQVAWNAMVVAALLVLGFVLKLVLARVLGAVVAFFTTRGRIGFEAAVLRPAGLPYVIESGTIRNSLDVHLVNKRSEAQAYAIDVVAPAGVAVIQPVPRPEVAGLADAHIPLVLTMPTASYEGDGKVAITIRSLGEGGDAKTVTIPFLGAKK